MDLLCAFSHLVLFWYSFRSCRLAISHRRNRKLSLLQLSGNLVLASSSKSAAVDPTVNVGTQAPVSAVLSPSIAPSLQTVESADLEVIASKFNAWFAAGACASAFTSFRYATISDQFVIIVYRWHSCDSFLSLPNYPPLAFIARCASVPWLC